MTDDEWNAALSADESDEDVVLFNSTSANVADDYSSAGADKGGGDMVQDIFAGASNYE